jgi:hypothetical protein
MFGVRYMNPGFWLKPPSAVEIVEALLQDERDAVKRVRGDYLHRFRTIREGFGAETDLLTAAFVEGQIRTLSRQTGEPGPDALDRRRQLTRERVRRHAGKSGRPGGNRAPVGLYGGLRGSRDQEALQAIHTLAVAFLIQFGLDPARLSDFLPRALCAPRDRWYEAPTVGGLSVSVPAARRTRGWTSSAQQ